jgi:hypothetical protein
MHTQTHEAHEHSRKPSLTPYVVTWVSAVGIFTLLIWVGVWLVQQQ